MESYLKGRRAYVIWNGFSSNTFPVTLGVPQRFCLGTLVFNIFISDLLEKLKCDCMSYADDFNSYSVVDNCIGDIILTYKGTLDISTIGVPAIIFL